MKSCVGGLTDFDHEGIPEPGDSKGEGPLPFSHQPHFRSWWDRQKALP